MSDSSMLSILDLLTIQPHTQQNPLQNVVNLTQILSPFQQNGFQLLRLLDPLNSLDIFNETVNGSVDSSLSFIFSTNIFNPVAQQENYNAFIADSTLGRALNRSDLFHFLGDVSRLGALINPRIPPPDRQDEIPTTVPTSSTPPVPSPEEEEEDTRSPLYSCKFSGYSFPFTPNPDVGSTTNCKCGADCTVKTMADVGVLQQCTQIESLWFPRDASFSSSVLEFPRLEKSLMLVLPQINGLEEIRFPQLRTTSHLELARLKTKVHLPVLENVEGFVASFVGGFSAHMPELKSVGVMTVTEMEGDPVDVVFPSLVRVESMSFTYNSNLRSVSMPKLEFVCGVEYGITMTNSSVLERVSLPSLRKLKALELQYLPQLESFASKLTTEPSNLILRSVPLTVEQIFSNMP